MVFESNGNPKLTARGVDQRVTATQGGGNMEGKETRFGPAASGLFAASTTGTSTGAVNSMHDSFTPIGGAAPLVNIMLGEVEPGRHGLRPLRHVAVRPARRCSSPASWSAERPSTSARRSKRPR